MHISQNMLFWENPPYVCAHYPELLTNSISYDMLFLVPKKYKFSRKEMQMPIPKVNIEEVSRGIIGVHAAMYAAQQKFDETTLAYFLDLLPERGEQLWERFRKWQKEKGDNVSFLDFIRMIVSVDPVKLFFPKECTLDSMTRMLLSGEIRKAVLAKGIKSNADIMQIYFGEGVIYETARGISCKGCPQFRCRHNLRLFQKKGRQW